MGSNEKTVGPVKRGNQQAKQWQSDRAASFGAAVRFWRDQLGLSAVELSNRTREIGFPITRGTIANIENNSRNAKVDLAEVVTLAAALEITPSDLVFYGQPDLPHRVLPKAEMRAEEGRQWFGGDDEYNQWEDFTYPRIHQSLRRRQANNDYEEALKAFEKRRLVRFENGEYSLFVQVQCDPWEDEERKKRAQLLLAGEMKQIEELRFEAGKLGAVIKPPAWLRGEYRVREEPF
nr:MAG TPA_asm: hypothetical protein [Caudoviricetes sp.]